MARSLQTLLAVRFLLIANALVLIAVGALSLMFVERPSGVFVAALAWLSAGCLFGCLPLTDPYRDEKGRLTRGSRAARRRRARAARARHKSPE